MTTLPASSPRLNILTDVADPIYDPIVHALSNGSYVALWSLEDSAGRLQAWMQIFNADGTAKSAPAEIKLKDEVENLGKFGPSVAVLNDGNFVVAWQDTSERDDEVDVGIRGQIFNSEGQKVGVDFRLNSETAGYQGDLSIAALANGGFALSYTDVGGTGDGSGPCVKTRVFDAHGKPVARPNEDPNDLVDAVANASTVNGQLDPKTLALQGGGYLVLYEDNSLSESDPNTTLRGRIFNADGTPAAYAEFLVPMPGAPGIKHFASAALLANGKFVVTWEAVSESTGSSQVMARVFNADGTGLTDDLVLNEGSGAFQSDPQVTALGDGGFAVIYKSQAADDGSPDGYRIATFSGSGTQTLDMMVEIGEGATVEGKPSIATLRDGRLLVSWTEHVLSADTSSTHAQIFDPRTSAVHVVGTSTNDQYFGTAFNDVLNGLGGADRMNGGAGNDTYYVDNVGDMVIEGVSGSGTDLVYSWISYALAGDIENLAALGSSSLSLYGNGLSNTIIGNAGRNTIKSGSGNDALYGGSGKDSFVFNTKPSSKSNKDYVKDWDYRYDTIKLENAVFKSLKKAGTLSKSFFVLGTKAKDKNDYVGYNSKTGDLWYDANGSKSGGQVTIANLGKKEKIYYKDFYVI